MHHVVVEQKPIHLIARTGLHDSAADVPLAVSHRRESQFSQNLLQVLVAVVDWDAVECMQDRYVYEPVPVVVEEV